MTHIATTAKFKDNVHEALTDARLQGALGHARNFITRRAASAERLPEFEALRDSARAIKDHTLAHLDLYLEAYERKVKESGGEVHYAQDADEARTIILDLCKSMGAKSVTKGKSMIAEEIGLNQALEAAGIEAVETDLGEYIIQLRGETPSHIIAPAIHVTKEDVEREFRKAHRDLPPDRSLADPEQLLAEARQVLRAKFLAADVGITGANFLIAETGTSIIVTNEGNGDLTQILPRAHIVIASIEKITPTLEDAAQLLRVLSRSATGQDTVGLHHALDRSAAAGRPRWSQRLSRRYPRQRPLVDAGRGIRGHAALHPVRRLHEPLPRLSSRRRACLRLGLSGTDGGGAYALAHRRRRRRTIAQRLDLLRALRRSLPGPHSVAQNDAALARARIRAAPLTCAAALRPRVLGVFRQPSGALSPLDRSRRAGHAPHRPRQGPVFLSALRRRVDAVSRPRGAAGRRHSRASGGAGAER